MNTKANTKANTAGLPAWIQEAKQAKLQSKADLYDRLVRAMRNGGVLRFEDGLIDCELSPNVNVVLVTQEEVSELR